MNTRYQSFWPKDVPQTVLLPETSLWYNLEVSAKRYPSLTCTIFYDSKLSYAEMFDRSESLAGYLQQVCGVKRGDRVGLYMQNSPAYIIAFYAVLRADAMVVPINPMNRATEVGYVLQDCDAKVLLGAQDLAENFTPHLKSGLLDHAVVFTYADFLTVDTDLAVPDFVREARLAIDAPGAIAYADAHAQGRTPAPHQAGPEDLCVLPYTSGTTGHPKGCVHTHRTVMHTTLAGARWHRRVGGDECVLTVLPLFHVTGMQNSMNGPIAGAATMVLLPRWDRTVAAQLIERYEVTGFVAVPAMIVDLLGSDDCEKYDLSSIRMLGGGGAAMPEAISQKLEDTFSITYLEGYGLSETIAATHMNPPDRPKPQCLGIPIFGVDSRVVNPDTLEELPAGEVGEIITHGPQVFRGYWNKPEANEQCFVTLEGKRFFRTGDLARTDEDGYFFLVDRIKRMINAAGYKVWPAEVENLLYGHPGIREACIISQRDPRRGETVKAVVVPHAHMDVTEEAILAWSRENMAAYKVPRSVQFVTELPKSAQGKVLWRVLQEQEDAQASTPPPSASPT